jgi:hypothetical protein
VLDGGYGQHMHPLLVYGAVSGQLITALPRPGVRARPKVRSRSSHADSRHSSMVPGPRASWYVVTSRLRCPSFSIASTSFDAELGDVEYVIGI